MLRHCILFIIIKHVYCNTCDHHRLRKERKISLYQVDIKYTSQEKGKICIIIKADFSLIESNQLWEL